MENRPISVVLADDHTLLREGLAKLLDMEVGIKVVGQAVDGREAIQLAEKLGPDVILMDINMPHLNGIEATREIRARLPHVQVLALTIHDDEEYISEMIRAGARGYVLKDVDATNLRQAIMRVAAGENYLPSALMEKVMERLHQLSDAQRRGTTEIAATAEQTTLTQRELEVLECIVQGQSNKEIAASLFISEKTVKNHITNLLRKLDVADRTQAAVYAVQHGIIKARD